MSSRPATRFAISYDDVARELFSVRQLPDGSLLVRLRNALNHEDTETGKNVPITADRFSVHPSPKSSGATFKHTTELKNSQVRTSVQFVRDSKVRLLAPLVTVLCPILGERYNLTQKPKDTVVKLGSFFKTDQATLIYTIIVASPGSEFPRQDWHFLKHADFSNFSLGIYLSYVNVPAIAAGDLGVPASSAAQVDGVPVTGSRLLPGGTPSFAPEDLVDYVLEMHKRAAAKLVMRIAQALPDEADALMRYPLHFHPNPWSLEFARRERGGL